METFTTGEGSEWRSWLAAHFETSSEIWFVLPLKEAGEESLIYTDAAEEALRQDETAWENYRKLSEPYKRIRVACIDAARGRPEEFRKRPDSFMEKTRRNKRIKGCGGIDKYYASDLNETQNHGKIIK